MICYSCEEEAVKKDYYRCDKCIEADTLTLEDSALKIKSICDSILVDIESINSQLRGLK